MTQAEKLLLLNQLVIMQALAQINEIPKVVVDDLHKQITTTFTATR